MKRLILSALALITMFVQFSACSKNNIYTQPIDFIFINDKQKYGLQDDSGDILIDAVYDSYYIAGERIIFDSIKPNGTTVSSIYNLEGNKLNEYEKVDFEANDYAKYWIGRISSGSKEKIFFNDLGEPFYKNAECYQYWVIGPNGQPALNQYFDYCALFYENGSLILKAHKNGNLYVYVEADGIFSLCEEKKAGKIEEAFDYEIHSRYENLYAPYFGIKDKTGNTLFETKYFKLSIPFCDRTLIYHGESGLLTAADEGLCLIYDMAGNKLAAYNVVEYFIFGDSYIGVAYSAGEEAYLKCYDQNGNIRNYGFWFVDKNGNAISECFEGFMNENSWIPKIESPDEMIIAIDKNGNTIEFPVKTYLLFE
ncbi:MAG: hypothetical protein IJ283_07830 [Oscillospiraceae bacterium]|nr:hypothetical protein [Oscillospiraceae bacterium]